MPFRWGFIIVPSIERIPTPRNEDKPGDTNVKQTKNKEAPVNRVRGKTSLNILSAFANISFTAPKMPTNKRHCPPTLDWSTVSYKKQPGDEKSMNSKSGAGPLLNLHTRTATYCSKRSRDGRKDRDSGISFRHGNV